MPFTMPTNASGRRAVASVTVAIGQQSDLGCRESDFREVNADRDADETDCCGVNEPGGVQQQGVTSGSRGRARIEGGHVISALRSCRVQGRGVAVVSDGLSRGLR